MLVLLLCPSQRTYRYRVDFRVVQMCVSAARFDILVPEPFRNCDDVAVCTIHLVAGSRAHVILTVKMTIYVTYSKWEAGHITSIRYRLLTLQVGHG